MSRSNWIRAGLLVSILGMVVSLAQARQTLIYSETSALTDPVAEGWAAAAQIRGQAVHVRDQVRFLTELWSAPWDRVVLIGHATIDSLVLEAALSDFARSAPDSSIVITLLDNRFIAADAYANADVPIVTTTWNRGFWATQYLGLVSTDPIERQTRSGAGFEFPSFEGIEVVRPAIGRALAAHGRAAGEGTRGVDPKPCPQCNTNYQNDLNDCNTDRDDYVDMCNGVYGPNGSEPNPDQYNTCISDGNTIHTNRVSAATKRFKLCRKFHNCDPPIKT